MTTWLQTESFKLTPSADCWTTHEGDTVCPLPGDPFPAVPHQTIPGSWDGYTISDCLPTLARAPLNTPISKVSGMCADPIYNESGARSPFTDALAQQALHEAIHPRSADPEFNSLMDGGAPADFSGLFVGAAILAVVAASGVALLLAKKRRKNLAKKQEATA